MKDLAANIDELGEIALRIKAERDALTMALAECASRFERALIHSGTDPDFASEAAKEYRALVRS